MENYTVQDLFKDTDTFNRISNNYQDITQTAFDNQLNLVIEEHNELVMAHKEQNIVEICDAICDSLITLFGYQRKIEECYGVDFSKAMNLVADNNLEKYPLDEQVAIDTVKMYQEKGLDTYYTFYPEGLCYVIRDSKTNKIKKPIGFKPVDLSDCFPKVH